MDSIGGMLNPIGKMPKTHYKKRNFVMVLLEKANGLSWYFNRNHWDFCDGFYWASIVFLAGFSLFKCCNLRVTFL